MSDLSNGHAWVIVLSLPVVVWLFNQSWVRRPLWTAAAPMITRLAARLTQVEEPAPEVLELWNVVRRQRLEGDLDRISRLVATDTWMSATRQLGNRLAYAQLVDELAQIPVSDVGLTPWATPARVPMPLFVDDAAFPSGSSVEIMEIGRSPRPIWGRRTLGAAGHRHGG